MLQRIKRTIARVEIDGVPNGTAFLISRKHVATALHVLAQQSLDHLVFVEWSRSDRKRVGARRWIDPRGNDVAILELDQECPADVEPVPWAASAPVTGDRWITFGFPSQLPNGHLL